MLTQRFSASAVLNSPPDSVYHVIADYQNSHPQIIPNPPFVKLTVEKGGFGAGTHLYVEMKILGQVHSFRGIVSEPVPGFKIVESYDTGYVTSFDIVSRENGSKSFVEIATEMPQKSGVSGLLESFFIPKLLRPVYVRELALIESLARKQT